MIINSDNFILFQLNASIKLNKFVEKNYYFKLNF